MSFLAKLRQQTPAGSNSQLQLSYLLHIASGRVKLRLALMELSQGQVRSYSAPYRIQQQHLISPPPFYLDGDVEMLRNLIDQCPHWSGAEDVDLSGVLYRKQLNNMLASGRAFTQTALNTWFAFGKPKSFHPQLIWQIDSAGLQTLSWVELPTSATFGLVDAHGIQLKTGDIAFIEHPILKSEFAAWLSQNLHYLQVERFLFEHKSNWLQLGLPLPQRLVHQTGEIQSINALLRCATRGERSELRLQLRLQTSIMGVQLDYADCQETVCVWDGEKIQQFHVDSEWQQKLHQSLTELLKDFHPGDEEGVWYSNIPSTWRHFLLAKRSELAVFDIALEVEPGFAFHFVEVEQWQVGVQTRDGTMQLELHGQSAGATFDILPLLAELFTQPSAAGSGEIHLNLNDKILVLPEKLCGLLSEEFADLMAWQKISDPVPLNQLYRLSQLDQILPEAQWQDDDQLLSRAKRLRAQPAIPDVQASGVKAELRSYQWLGVCWLQHLSNLNINGLLADDMGLGKTLQTLSHLSVQFQQQEDLAPALIVAPTSLLNNWASEIQKFCPHLKCILVHGNQRHRIWTKIENYQILITSYHLVVNDLAEWRAQTLSWLILDEAQYIKNPRTQISRALRQVPARQRLCLTGTPVENHLSELWSIMDFLEPGILGTQKQFREYYQKPIEEDLVAERMNQLLDRLEPIMLRRTKQQVAKDLPEKTLIPRVIPFADEQVDLYQRIREQGWSQLQDTLASEIPEGQKHLQMMTALVRLRQVCCDPELIGESVPSAKTQACMDMVEELVGEGRSVLIFSQFTSMLSILARRLEQRDIAYFQLTGSTRNRAELVDGFQRGERPVFLISLKAGGVGLNLTRADTVIHFDPWWNSAAEQQASDRAHRIGQTQPVFVYKLIMADSIEEKIARMQVAKAALSEHVHQRAQRSGEAFALNMRDLIELWKDE